MIVYWNAMTRLLFCNRLLSGMINSLDHLDWSLNISCWRYRYLVFLNSKLPFFITQTIHFGDTFQTNRMMQNNSVIPVPQRSKTINKLVYITTFLLLHVFPLVLLKLSTGKNLSTVIQYHHATTTWFCKMLTWIWKLILTNLYLKLFFCTFHVNRPF